jgi:hypothetical protein
VSTLDPTKWEIIGETTLDITGKADKVVPATTGNFASLDATGNLTDSKCSASSFKVIQTAVSDPSASGTSITFIDSISQDAQGIITPTKKTVANAAASTSGVGGSAGLMTAADKEKLDGIAAGAEVNVQSDWSETSACSDAYIDNKPTALSDFTDDITTDTYDSAGTAPVNGQAVADALTGYKQVQSAVADPSVGTTTALAFIDSISQDAQGVITPTKKNITEATTSVGGLMSASDKTKLDALPTNSELEAALADKKDVQTAVSDPSASGTSITFIDSISQDAQGVITPTKKTVANASASTSGVGGSAGLMSATDKEKLDGIEAGAEANVQADWSQTTTGADDYIKNKPTALSDFSDDITEQTYIPTGEGSANPISGAGVASAMSSYKPKQTAVVDPTTAGTAVEFIDSISQDADGVISPTKKAIPNAVASSSGTGGSAGLMTGADKEKLDDIEAGAQVNVQSDWSQSSSSADDYIKNKPTALSDFTDDITSQTYVGAGTGSDAPISGAGVKDALDTLDVTIEGTAGTDKTAAVTQTNGVVSVTYRDIQIAESQVTNLGTDLGNKADKVSSATNGNFAGLDSNGNLTDSGNKAADFATAAQGALAATAVQGVTVNGTSVVDGSTKIAAIPAASTVAYGAVIFETTDLPDLPAQSNNTPSEEQNP